METVHWGSNFNSAFHGNPSSLPFNFNRTLVKNSSFNELASTHSFDSIAASKLDVGMFPALSSAVLASASTSFVPSTAISPFFHSLPTLSRSISSDYTATPAVASVNMDNLELESPDSDSRSLCLSPDERADREHASREVADMDSPPAEHSPRSDTDSDEWSVPNTNTENDTVNHSHAQALPIVPNSSLLDIAEAMQVVHAVKKEEFSDSDNEEADSQQGDSEDEQKEAEQEQEEHDEEEAVAEEDEADSEAEEIEVPAPRKSRAQPKRRQQHARSLAKPSRRGANSSSNRRAPISSAARLASQKKYDEKRRGIYRCLYTDLKDAIRAAQKVDGVKTEAQDERSGELKKGKKKKKRKQKEIEDLSTRELLMLASNTIAQLQNRKNQLDEEWSTVKVQAAAHDDDESSMKANKAGDRKRKRGSAKTEPTTKSIKRGHAATADADHELSAPKRSRTETSSSSSSSSALFSPSALISALSNSITLTDSSTLSFTSSQLSAVRSSSLPVKSEAANSSSSSTPSPLLLVGASSTSSPPSADASKRRSIFRLLFLRLRTLIIGSRPMLNLLNSAASGQLWRAVLVSLLHTEWSEAEIQSMPEEKVFVKTSQVIAALQWLLEEIERASGDSHVEMKQEWNAVKNVKRKMEAACSGNATDDSADDS